MSNVSGRSDAPLRCHFWTDEEGALGLESEYSGGDGIVRCSAKATGLVRLRSGATRNVTQGRQLIQAGHMPVCHSHLVHMAEEAQIEWEALAINKEPDEIKERERTNLDFIPAVDEENPRYVDTGGDGV